MATSSEVFFMFGLWRFTAVVLNFMEEIANSLKTLVHASNSTKTNRFSREIFHSFEMSKHFSTKKCTDLLCKQLEWIVAGSMWACCWMDSKLHATSTYGKMTHFSACVKIDYNMISQTFTLLYRRFLITTKLEEFTHTQMNVLAFAYCDNS